MTTQIPVEAPAEEEKVTTRNTLRSDARQFYQRGLIDEARLQAMLTEINDGVISTDQDLVDDLHEAVSKTPSRDMSGKERLEQHALAQETLEDMGLPADTKDWRGDESWSTKIINTPLRALGDLIGGVARQVGIDDLPVDAAHGTHEQRTEEEEDAFKDMKVAFVRDLLSQKVITDEQYNELVRDHGLFVPGKSLTDIMDVLSNEFGVSDSVIEESYGTAGTATLRRRNKELEAQELVEEQAGQVASYLTSDEKIQAKKDFERLEDGRPGKYMFNEETGRIYETGSGQLVDSNGTVAIMDSEGNYGDAFGDMEPGDEYWEVAANTLTPWDEYQIEEDSYYSLLDVVDNPNRYHQGGIDRFASAESFLGGFSADYAVAQDRGVQEEQLTQGLRSDVEARGLGAMRGGAYRDYLDKDYQEVRRPWYDEGDNWALYAGMSPESIAVEQGKLVAMGALEKNDVVQGQWGPAEAGAVERMMTIANGRAEKLEDIDGSFWDSYWADANSGGAASQRAAFVAPAYSKLDPARAQLTIEDTVRRLLGRDATNDELADLGLHMQDMHRQSFAADVQALEQEYDATTRAIDTDTAQSGGEVQGVDWEAQFMTKFNERNAAELDRAERTDKSTQRQQLIGGAMNNFMNQLGGGIGGGSMGGM